MFMCVHRPQHSAHGSSSSGRHSNATPAGTLQSPTAPQTASAKCMCCARQALPYHKERVLQRLCCRGSPGWVPVTQDGDQVDGFRGPGGDDLRHWDGRVLQRRVGRGGGQEWEGGYEQVRKIKGAGQMKRVHHLVHAGRMHTENPVGSPKGS